MTTFLFFFVFNILKLKTLNRHHFVFQDVEIKEEGTKHILILYNVRMDMAGPVDFSAANAKSNAQLRVKGQTSIFCFSFVPLAEIYF